MYIDFELYRAKNDEKFDSEAIEWVLEKPEDLIEIDRRIRDVLTQHISNLDVVKKYGIAYIGRMKIVAIEINDNDNVEDLDEEHFRAYMANPEVMPHLNIIWNKKDGKEISNEGTI